MGAYAEVYDHPNKGHDRAFLSPDHGFAAIFDGAGQDRLSSYAVVQLPELLDQYADLTATNSISAMAKLAHALDNPHHEMYLDVGYSTAAMALVGRSKDAQAVTYFNGGDSSLYIADRTSRSFRLLAHREASLTDDGYISVEGFLGNMRSYEDISKNVGRVLIAEGHEFVVIGMSDGVLDDDGQGINPDVLKSIALESETADIASEIMRAIPEAYDDASVFVAC